MEQTAVEFLEKEITEILSYIEEDGAYAIQGTKDKLFGENNIIQQAKEMEKQHIIDAYKKAHEDGYHFEGSVSDYEAEGLEEHLAEQYYNETFKSE